MSEDFSLDDLFAAVSTEADMLGNCNHKFVHQENVLLWVDFITGRNLRKADLIEAEDNRSPLPFRDLKLVSYLKHTLWFLPNVAACFAMRDVLVSDPFFRNYHINVAAGNEAGMGLDALKPVKNSIGINPRNTLTITLTCGKLTTGVSVPAWTAVFMLRSLKSPESYFQTAFRVQTPWVMRNSDPDDPHAVEIMKEKCYVFDFDPKRALGLAAEYSLKLPSSRIDNAGIPSVTSMVGDFLSFLPVLCHDDGVMIELQPQDIIDIAISGIGTAMLARRFQSKRMVDLSLMSIANLRSNPGLINRLQNIEAFRNLNAELNAITKSKSDVKASKDKGLPLSQPLTEAEKEANKSLAEIRDNLLKFVTRLPVFMYLNDEREKSVIEVIYETDSRLFKKATGISKEDFSDLVDYGIFNSGFMNETILAFKRVEDIALVYMGDRVIDGAVGAWDVTVDRDYAGDIVSGSFINGPIASHGELMEVSPV